MKFIILMAWNCGLRVYKTVETSIYWLSRILASNIIPNITANYWVQHADGACTSSQSQGQLVVLDPLFASVFQTILMMHEQMWRQSVSSNLCNGTEYRKRRSWTVKESRNWFAIILHFYRWRRENTSIDI